MKKLLLLLCTLLILSSSSLAGNTAVTATITGKDGQTWNNGTYIITFRPTPGVPGPYTVNGVVFNQGPFTGSLSASGVLTVTVTDNLTIQPGGSTWVFTICPNASNQCLSTFIAVTGATQNLSTVLSAATPVISVTAGTVPRAYLDSQVTTPAGIGSTYYDTLNTTPKWWDGSTWQSPTVINNNPQPSDGSVGNNHLAIFDGTNWISATTSDTASQTELIYSGGTTSSVFLFVYGVTSCVFDTAAPTNGDWVIVSTVTKNNCRDSGVSGNTIPSGKRILGTVYGPCVSTTCQIFYSPFYSPVTTGVYNSTVGTLPVRDVVGFTDSPLSVAGGVVTNTDALEVAAGTGASDLGFYVGAKTNKNGFYATASNLIGVAAGVVAFNLAQTNASFGATVTTQKIFGSGIASNTDGFGQCTLGTNCVITFAVTYTSAPICIGTDTTAAAAVKVVVTTTNATFTGTGTDVINYACFMRN